MYEEEDDDLPMQYRRLTAHLQTSNAEFDRRLAAYLTNHVAMRTALGQAQSQGGMYPNSAQFANQGNQSQFPSPFNQQGSMGPPQSNQSPMMSRQSPYPANQYGMKQAMHSRSSSFATPNDIQGFSTLSNQNAMNAADSRRNSMPVSASGTPQVKKSPTSIANLKYEAQTPKGLSMLSPPKSESDSKSATPKPSSSQQLRPSEFPNPFDMSSNTFGGMNSMPFSTTLPMESQQLLGGAFDQSDPMTAMLLGPNYQPDQPFYNYEDPKQQKTNFSQSTGFNGMNQTLAPSYLDTSVGGYGMDSMPNSAFTDASPFATSAGGYGLGIDSQFNDAFKAGGFGTGFGSGQVTPNTDKEWQSLIDGNAWEEQTQPTA